MQNCELELSHVNIFKSMYQQQYHDYFMKAHQARHYDGTVSIPFPRKLQNRLKIDG
jgi:hypothetical protein